MTAKSIMDLLSIQKASMTVNRLKLYAGFNEKKK